MPTEKTNTNDGVQAKVSKADAKRQAVLEKELEEARARVAELEAERVASTVVILTPEQKSWICDFDNAQLADEGNYTLGDTTYSKRRCPTDEGHVKLVPVE